MNRILLLVAVVLTCALSAFGQVTTYKARSEISGTAVPDAACNPGPPWRDIYIRTSNNHVYQCTAAPATWTDITASLTTAWGSITGTLSAQTDLQSALNAKASLTGPTFTGPITSTQGTITTSQPFINHTATWNDGAVTFTNIKSNVTSTGSAALSLLMDLQVGGVSQFKVNKAGVLTVNSCIGCGGITINATNDVLPKRLSATAFTDSRITDISGGGIEVNSGANNPVVIGDVNGAGSATRITVSDGPKTIAGEAQASFTAGDINAAVNGMIVLVDVVNGETYLGSNAAFEAGFGYSSRISGGNRYVSLGDPAQVSSGTSLKVDDVAQLIMVSDAIVPLFGAGASDLGTAALPFGSLFIGNAATNNIQITGTATAPRMLTLSDASGTVGLVIPSTSGSIGGGALLAGACASGTTAVTSSTTTMTVSVSPNTYPGDGVLWYGYVSANGTVTVKVCGVIAVTPTASTYNIRVIQ